jgi:hypothetical protein
MRHAFLITAYRDWGALKSLIEQLLKFENSKIYVNIDKRSFQLIENLEVLISNYQHTRIYLRKNEVIHWGGYSHLLAFVDLMNEALKDKCDYFHTMTGQCRITKPTLEFLDFFEKNKTNSYIEHFPLPHKSWPGNGGLDRVKFHQLYDQLDAKKYPKIFRRLNKHFIHLQKFLRINRLKSNVYYGGSSYFSLSKEACIFLLEGFLSRKNEFKNTFCPEEIAFHTILLNAPKVINRNLVNSNLRYVLWEEKNGEIPGILDDVDLDIIKDKRYFFARKFDSTISKSLIQNLI